MAVDYVRKYDNIELGLADASIIVRADRHGTSAVLTLDEHHFRTVRRGNGDAFELLPEVGR
jgi:uncharacterized protein